MTRHPSCNTVLRQRNRGVTLIELMVGLTIGLLSVVIISQVMVTAENQKRTTTSGSDAQINGAQALETLQRDLRSSGYGLTGHPVGLGCQIKGSYSGMGLSPADAWLLAPVRIVQGADNAPDRIRVMMSDVKTYAVPFIVSEDHAAVGDKFVMRNDMTGAIADGDMMLAIPGDFQTNSNAAVNWCTLFTAHPAPVGKNIYHVADGASAPWNATNGFPATGYPAGSIVVNAGTFVNREYSIAGNQLQRVSFSTDKGAFGAPEIMFSQIVDLQATYGKETTGAKKGVVNVWEETEPTTPAGWGQLVAVRVAVLARSAQAEKDDVTTAPPVWYPDGVTAVSFKTEAIPEWKKYRYKVYESVIPLRNMLWQTKSEDE